MCYITLNFCKSWNEKGKVLMTLTSQGYTQFGGQRPFGVSLLYAGWWDSRLQNALLHASCIALFSSWVCVVGQKSECVAVRNQNYLHVWPWCLGTCRYIRDEHYGFQLYQSDPSGNYGGWKAVAIGAGHQAANNLLKSDFKEDMTLAEVRWTTAGVDWTYVFSSSHDALRARFELVM
jgi:hypothetical protein